MPAVKRKSNLGKTCVCEPSYKHRSTYFECNTYDGIVTNTEDIVKSGTFNVVMTSRSNKHVKINSNQTVGILKSCLDTGISTIHEIVTFEQISLRSGKRTNLTHLNKPESKTDLPTKPKSKHRVHIRRSDLFQSERKKQAKWFTKHCLRKILSLLKQMKQAHKKTM